MKKLVVFYEHPDAHQNRFYDNLSKVSNIAIEKFENKTDYFRKTKDHRIYGEVLDYCEQNEIDYLLMPFFIYPEYLLAELEARKIKTEISLGTAFSQWHKYMPRVQAYIVLMRYECIKSIFCYSIDGTEMKFPDFAKSLCFFDKFRPWYEFVQEPSNEYNVKVSKKDYGFDESDFCILFFGSMFYGKGVDIFADALLHLEEATKFIISSDKDSVNFDFNPGVFANRYDTKFFNKFVSNEKKMKMFSVCDAIVFPYRRTYEYASSAVFVQAMVAKKLVIVPDFYPFNKVVKQYSLGLVFDPEDSTSLAKIMDKMHREYKKLYEKADFDRYINRINTWEEIFQEVTK